jgi:hypothetical protein
MTTESLYAFLMLKSLFCFNYIIFIISSFLLLVDVLIFISGVNPTKHFPRKIIEVSIFAIKLDCSKVALAGLTPGL